MKLFTTILAVLAATLAAQAQNGWVKVTDPANPVVTFHPFGGYNGASWVDIDNDGDIDLFAAPDNLFRNDGNGVFVRLTTPIGSGTTLKPSGSSWADFDNDGDIDCFLSSKPSRLYRNNGNGAFTEDTAVFTVLADYPSWGCAWGEVNNDGRLDLVLAHPRGFLGMPYYPGFYFRQSGSGRLVPVTGYHFTDSLAPYTVPYWSDYDLDGDMDLFIASGPGGSAGPDFHYRNMLKETGIDTLVPITNTQFATDMHDGQCYNFIDYDNDGDLDLCLTSWLGSATVLYNNNNGVYTAVPTPFSATKSSLSNAWGDFDNDGDLDVIIANDQNFAPGFYRNDGNGTFTAISNPITAKAGATSITLGDYDNDGDLDVFMMAADTTHAKALFRNDSLALGNHWVSFRCAGASANKSAIGTKVRIKATINGVPVWQIREVLAQNTFQGQHDLRVHFGLGKAAEIDSVAVDFLGGSTQVFTHVPADQFYQLTEGGGLSLAARAAGPPPALNFEVYPNPASGKLYIVMHEGKSDRITVTITDSNGQVVHTGRYHYAGSNPVPVRMEELSAGTYFVTVRLNGRSGTRQTVKL